MNSSAQQYGAAYGSPGSTLPGSESSSRTMSVLARVHGGSGSRLNHRDLPAGWSLPVSGGRARGLLAVPALLPFLMVASVLVTPRSEAMAIDTGSSDVSVRFDNTLKGSVLYRLEDADPRLVDSYRLIVPGVPASAFPQAQNFNAGDDNFRNAGIVSKRVDLLSELDVVYRGDMGLRVSGAAWYDAAYQQDSDAEDSANSQSPVNEFPDQAQRLAGGDKEILDAFVFGAWDVGDEGRLSARLGRHALQYGESLFFGDNGIARAQGPIDINKLVSSPNAQFKEIIRPVNQLSAQYQLDADVSLGGYVQFGWEEDRLPPAGSYFSSSNLTWGSSQTELFESPYVLLAGDSEKPRDSGQYGLQLRWLLEDTDLGFYFARYHDKSGQLHGALNVMDPTNSRWFFTFPENITTFGVSASQTFDVVNMAVEASVRNNMPLRNHNIIYAEGLAPRPEMARGRTAHLNLSWLASFGPNWLAQESSLVGELAWNRVLTYNDPDEQVDHAVTRGASALQFVYSPSWRQVLAGVDLSLPVGMRYGINGNSSVTVWDPKGAGSVTAGLNALYLNVWNMGLNYTHYLGKAEPFVDYAPLQTGGDAEFSDGNPLADRDYVALTVRRTF
ncbi:DUF1302 domain-containing protein [Parathalassolituus penaei]|uniref:DUF1302 family protein n=1 Tax=Parathalassolituus penaei TaxID=2997323 RepID=A0A9X3ISD9_9GAMM|nr:DUF1302 family protein [Parathalassolituus penaei]MCY0964043.1 DUF1302 family protein [Parathalassolituus penaei]